MINRISVVVLAVAVAAFTSPGVAGYSISNPVEDSSYSTLLAILARGTTNQMGETIIVQIVKNGTVVAQQELTAPPMDVNWSYDFQPPNGQWDNHLNYKCRISAGGGYPAEVGFHLNNP